MLKSRFCSLFLALAVLPAFCQQAALPVPATPAYDVQSQEPDTQDKPVPIGGSVLAPKVIYQAEPKFSGETGQKKFSGKAGVSLWVEKDGSPSHIRVVKSVGHGLDEKAVEAVRQYKFKPAMRNGKPVKVELYIEVNFQIFDN
jgi:periplasmic protein TonB